MGIVLIGFFVFLGIIVTLHYVYMIALACTGISPLCTSKKAARIVIDIVQKEYAKKNMYDMGCGYGEFSLMVHAELPDTRIIAVDMSPLRIFYAKLFSFFRKGRISFLRKDLFTISVMDADVVYCYLPWSLMPRLEKKLLRELKNGALVITNTTVFPNWKLQEKRQTHIGNDYFEMLYVYRKE
ncbi:class I SAM-dependent methyltransferase [Candidatus Uhrbacteria bacterium]|nr:class I SAM-dependent methyltransferase [Candidatus Uhrbacteria bacterium]